MTHKIIIAPALDSNGNHRANRRGPLYTASYLGETIISASTQPLLDACRVLAGRGISGKLEMWSHDLPYPRMGCDIVKGAKLTIEEGDRRPRYVKFKSLNGRDALRVFSEPQATHTVPDKKSRSAAYPPPIAGD